jgi:thiosulfate dehydrogenase (quinone) large subunit
MTSAHQSDRPVDSRHPEPASRGWILGPRWASEGLRQPGWILLPLRVFLGFTFCYAGLSKLANPDFFNAASPASVQHQMAQLAPTSPIGPLVVLSLHAGITVGVAIAVGELAIGLGTLVGLFTRWAAGAGSLLALTFFLTVSWNTTPYYYGADIVFLFAWTPFIVIGAAGVLSADGWLHERAYARPGSSAAVLRPRRLVLSAGAATLTVAAATAAIGRFGRGKPASAASGTPTTRPSRTDTTRAPSGPRPDRKATRAAPTGTRIASVRSLPPGHAAQFTDPGSARPAWVVCVAKGRYAAHSAVCTHAGCTVNYDPGSSEFICPCHGGTFNARTGAVVAGPPPSPLAAIPVHVTGGQIYVG